MLQAKVQCIFSRLLPVVSSQCLSAPCSLARTLTSTPVSTSILCTRTTASSMRSNAGLLARRLYSSESDAEGGYIFKVESDEDFSEKVINSSVPVLVDFYADWCGPCKMLAPRIEAKVAGRQGALALAKVNVDYAGDLAMDYEVQAVPTVIAFKGGEMVDRFEGDHGDAHLDEFIDNLLS